MQVGGKRRAPAYLLPGKGLRTHCSGDCVGPRWVRKISPPPRFESRTVQPVQKSLYRLYYPSQRCIRYNIMKTWWTGEPVKQKRHETD